MSGEEQANRVNHQLAQARLQVLAVVSHDLRNPLNNISLAIDLLGDPELTAQERQKPLATIRRNVERAEHLLQDLLLLTRLECGQLELQRIAVDPGRLARQAADRFLERSPTARLAVDDAARAELPAVRVDKDRILQALVSLIDSAARNTRGTDPIRVAVETNGSRVRFCVADQHSTIAPSDLSHLFDSFWRENGEHRRRTLGLTIAKSLVEAHGGRIWAESDDSEATRLLFELPT